MSKNPIPAEIPAEIIRHGVNQLPEDTTLRNNALRLAEGMRIPPHEMKVYIDTTKWQVTNVMPV